jgi:heme/copper-type cytochrome/quinol oxidase subunit 2
MISAWYIYAIYSMTMNFIFAILVSGMVIGLIVKNYFFENEKDIDSENKKDIVRIIYTALSFLAFMAFFVISVKLGGSAAEDSYASWRYENYQDGEYYLSNHGNFTLVNYPTWIRMKIFEQIVMPMFCLSFLWNFFYIAKTKGIKFLFTGKKDDVGYTFKDSSLLLKIGFVLLCLFVSSICISIMFILF